MDQIAESYVKLTLAVGQHDPNYVDAYYGPGEWASSVKSENASLELINERAVQLRSKMGAEPPVLDPLGVLRWHYLAKQLEAMIGKVRLLRGQPMSFDDESATLYDVSDPGRSDEYYEQVLAQFEQVLPGPGTVGDRYDALRANFQVPREKLSAVFAASIDAARQRTKRYIPLPQDESFEIEYVSGEVWGAYNWYKGDAYSLIQVNTDFPMAIDRALHLACHEGYPGHHVYNALLEQHLAKGLGWQEFTVYALYSPQSLIAEGTAEYGVELSFPEDEREAFEQEVLFPLAGLDSGRWDEYLAARALFEKLGYASNDAAKRYLDGKASREETIEWLSRYTLSSRDRAEQRVRFIEHHRSYVVTYNLGLDLVRKYIDSKAANNEERWSEFTRLLSTPQTPSGLAVQ